MEITCPNCDALINFQSQEENATIICEKCASIIKTAELPKNEQPQVIPSPPQIKFKKPKAVLVCDIFAILGIIIGLIITIPSIYSYFKSMGFSSIFILRSISPWTITPLLFFALARLIHLCAKMTFTFDKVLDQLEKLNQKS